MSFLLNPYIYAAAAAPPTPPVSTGLVGWYIGTAVTVSAGAIDTWQDNSGLGNDLSQTNNSTYRPTHSTDKVVFDGSNDFLTGATEMSIGHIFIVATPSGTQSYGSLLATAPATTAAKHILIRNSTTNNMYFNNTVSIFGSSTSPNMRVNEAASTVLGTTKKQFNTKGTTATGVKLMTGRDMNGGTYASGDIYEILVYSSSLSDTDRNTVEDYLQAKYGL